MPQLCLTLPSRMGGNEFCLKKNLIRIAMDRGYVKKVGRGLDLLKIHTDIVTDGKIGVWDG